MCKGTKKSQLSKTMCGFFCIFAHMNSNDIITYSVETLLAGGIILYPTDTIWGIGCDARNHEAVERIYAIKERDHSKSMLVLVADGILATEADSRPTTYIMPREKWEPMLYGNVADNLPAADGSLGIRQPRHAFCQEVIRRLGAPLVSTSANLSGHPSPQTYSEIENAIKQRVDYCVPPLDEFMSAETRGSRIVKVNPDGTITVIRP